ncbi:PP2C family protein-serine/threonine phosphatase [Streptantibioticus rubrisoli]|uniref:Serine/threonine-protein phosphatase n=1 Tax=Streptantibioticus rubrisoli TaxID=1387313 RepID=A0ABT1PBL1_9ACTN|nr:PP2C family protein-serine/threonine phosphatase [Streptantibioticus rubrisoli]MCQ4042745.1 serine/threonine-protein phosphatase [Streptantibioticus rubrisoli]
MAVPFLLILAITLIDLPFPGSLHLGDLLIVVPVITAWYASPRLTGLVSVAAVAALVAIYVVRQSASPPQMAALIVASAFSTIARYLSKRHQREMIQVRTVSEAAQLAVLPPLPDRLGPLRLASLYLAAEDEAHIGGDLYAAVRTTTGTRLIIGDVRGKGLTAVGDAALIIGVFRDAARRQGTLPELATYLDRSVRSNTPGAIEPEQPGESFVTATILEIPDCEPVVRSVTCGHPSPLLLRANDIVPMEASHPAPPLGLAQLTKVTYHVDTFSMRADEALLLYTDGVIEARNGLGAFYPLAARLATRPHNHPAELLDRIRDDLLTYVGGRLGDDAAMIVVERQEVRKGGM